MKKRTLTNSEIAFTLDFIIEYSVKNFKKFTNEFAVGETNLSGCDLVADLVGFGEANRKADATRFGSYLGHLLEDLILTVLDVSNAKVIEKPSLNGTERIDFMCGNMAVDIKYRIGTKPDDYLRGMELTLETIQEAGLKPVLCVYSSDSARATLRHLENMGWTIIRGDETFAFLESISGFDLKGYLISRKWRFVPRPKS